MSAIISIKGRVQGVGFRPEVAKLARAQGLNGYIYNDTLGVELALSCNETQAKEFIKCLIQILRQNRPLARITSYKIRPSDELFSDFKILAPRKSSEQFAVILPDFAPCKDCLKELANAKLPRRFRHNFINCTNCGTRFSVMRKIPYDRAHSSMSGFAMCADCAREYEDINDRRFYAEPIACNHCGARLSGDLIKAAKLIKRGKIVAIKGVGGFNLLCNALNFEAVKRLRELKNRPSKPLAIMAKDIKMARTYAQISPKEERILKSQERPILLLKSHFKTAFNIHFNFKHIGIFLPTAPVFYNLFSLLDVPLVATSANLSGELIYTKKSQFKALKPDLIISHNRAILHAIDDSVAQVVAGRFFHLRQARGFSPEFYEHKIKKNLCILAIGMEEKNEFLIYKNGLCIRSPYIGDLKDLSVFKHFLSLLRFFVRNYKLKFDYILADLHPHFMHTEVISREFQTGNIIKIYHHAAHAMSLGRRNIRAFCFDGTGYKNPTHISGGEVLDVGRKLIKTAFSFDEFKLLNVKNNALLAYAIMKKYEIPYISEPNFDAALSNCTLFTSSLGRIIDAFAFVVLDLSKNEFDAHSGMLIESFYDENIKDIYDIDFQDGKIIYKDIFIKCQSEPKHLACSKFLNTIAHIIKALSPSKSAVLSGGVFCNKTLLSLLLNDKDYRFYVSTNDACIPTGELNYFLNEMEFIE